MALENKLGISNSLQLANEEEKITKRKALQLFETGFLNGLEAGSFDSGTSIVPGGLVIAFLSVRCG